MLDIKISVIGFFVGFFVGLSGMGAGALITPLLILLGTKPTLAIGSDLMYAAITKIFGTWVHLKQKTVDLTVAFYLALGSIPASFLGVQTMGFIKKHYEADAEKLMAKVLGYALLAIATFFLYKTYECYKDQKACRQKEYRNYHQDGMSLKRKLFTVGSGALVGLMVGLTSVGAGTLTMVILTALYGMTASRMVGTDVFHGLLLAFAAALAHLNQGNVDFSIVGGLLVGSIPGILLGSRLTIKLPEAPLRGILALFILMMGIKLVL